MKGRGSGGRITFSGIVLPSCISRLQNAGCRSLQELTGAPRPTQPDFATWGRSLPRLHWGGGRMQPKSVAGIGRSRVSAVDRDDDVRSFDQRSSPMARWRTALLGSAAAVAMLAGEPARGITIKDQVGAAGGRVRQQFAASDQIP